MKKTILFLLFMTLFSVSLQAQIPEGKLEAPPPLETEILPIESEISPTEEILETVIEEVITYPLELEPIPGLRITQFEEEGKKENPWGDEVRFQGFMEAEIGQFTIIDNFQEWFRLVMDQEENPSRIQLQGLMPIFGKLAGQIGGAIDPERGNYSGELNINFSRLELREVMKRDWTAFQFSYNYLEDDAMHLEGQLHELEVSGFKFTPQNFRLKPKGFYFDFVIEDALGNLVVRTEDYFLGFSGKTKLKSRASIDFFGNTIRDVKVEFRDYFVKISFDSKLFFGAKNKFEMECYPDGKIRFLRSFKTKTGEIISFTKPLIFKESTFSGEAEIQKRLNDGSSFLLLSEELNFSIDGAIEGTANLQKGALDGFTEKDTYFSFNLDPSLGYLDFFNLKR